jgi:uncharacterized pyridoxamine 5'-phosphate oxidase family protein
MMQSSGGTIAKFISGEPRAKYRNRGVAAENPVRSTIDIVRGGRSMTLEELFDFAMANPICALAIFFATGTPKKVFSQIKENPLVEVCFWSDTQMMRVDGEIEIVDEKELKEKLFSRHEFLQRLLKSADHPWFVLLRIAHGTIDFTSDAIGLSKIDSFEF